jgi:hypothetical protein
LLRIGQRATEQLKAQNNNLIRKIEKLDAEYSALMQELQRQN